MSHIDDDPSDGEMTAEQTKVAASLSAELIDRIDARLLSLIVNRNRKVARIVGSAMMDETLRVPGLPDLFYRNRVKCLVKNGFVVADGDLDDMRYSEVRLPE